MRKLRIFNFENIFKTRGSSIQFSQKSKVKFIYY
jgi:hypothetical protein